MFVSEKRRLALLNRLIEVLGREEAEFLMDSLPPFDWHQLATKGDLKAMEDRLCSGTSAGFAKVDAQLAKVDARFAKVDAQLAKVNAEFTKLRGEIALQFARQTRTIVFTMLGLVVPILGAILAVGLG